MSNDLFKEHHPHSLSDYLSRSTVGTSRGVVKKIGKKSYVTSSIIANTILSSLSMVLANSLHQKIVFHGDKNRDEIEDLLCEANDTHFHVLVCRDLVEPKKSILVWTYLLRGLAIFLFRALAYLSPKAGHRTLGYMYEKSVIDYTNWIEAIEAGDITNVEASKMAIGYYELAENSMLTDVLMAMRGDNIKYRDIEHGYADSRIR